MADQAISVVEAAEMLGIGLGLALTLALKGRLPGCKRVEGSYRVSRWAIEETVKTLPRQIDAARKRRFGELYAD